MWVYWSTSSVFLDMPKPNDLRNVVPFLPDDAAASPPPPPPPPAADNWSSPSKNLADVDASAAVLFCGQWIDT